MSAAVLARRIVSGLLVALLLGGLLGLLRTSSGFLRLLCGFDWLLGGIIVPLDMTRPVALVAATSMRMRRAAR